MTKKYYKNSLDAITKIISSKCQLKISGIFN